MSHRLAYLVISLLAATTLITSVYGAVSAQSELDTARPTPTPTPYPADPITINTITEETENNQQYLLAGAAAISGLTVYTGTLPSGGVFVVEMSYTAGDVMNGGLLLMVLLVLLFSEARQIAHMASKH